MCFDPVSMGALISGIGSTTLGTIATVASLAGTAVSAYSMMQNSRAQAAVATQNAAAQEEAALDAIEQGAQESDRRRAAGAAMMSENITALASGGVDVSSEPAIDLLDEQRDLVEQDAFVLRENARRAAKGHAQQAGNYRSEAATARSNAFFGPLSTILGGVAKVGSKYASYATPSQNKPSYG